MDRGTEGSRAIGTKLRQYVSYHASGAEQAAHGVFPKVLWTVPDETRANVIRGCIKQLASGERELFEVAVFGEVMAGLVAGHLGRQMQTKHY